MKDSRGFGIGSLRKDSRQRIAGFFQGGDHPFTHPTKRSENFADTVIRPSYGRAAERKLVGDDGIVREKRARPLRPFHRED